MRPVSRTETPRGQKGRPCRSSWSGGSAACLACPTRAALPSLPYPPPSERICHAELPDSRVHDRGRPVEGRTRPTHHVLNRVAVQRVERVGADRQLLASHLERLLEPQIQLVRRVQPPRSERLHV